MKKVFIMILIIILAPFSFFGCTQNNPEVIKIYRCELPENSGFNSLEEAIDFAIPKIENIIHDYFGGEITIEKDGINQIKLLGSNIDKEFLCLFETQKMVYVSIDENFDVHNPNGEFVSGTDIENVYVSYNNQDSCYGVVLDFNSNGSEMFKNITTDAANGDQTLYINIGEGELLKVSCGQEVTNGQVFIYGGILQDYTSAREYAIMILSGSIGVRLIAVD